MLTRHAGVAFLLVAPLALLPNCSDQESEPFGVAGPGSPDDGGRGGGDVPPPQPAQPHPNKNPQPEVVTCARRLTPPASGTCAVTKTGSAGTILQGTILAPDETLRGGEVLFDAEGTILCAACDCSATPAYDAASVITCADGVISPGLVNPHDHITYANNKPVAHGTIRYENRSDWGGARGHQRLVYESGANQTTQAYAELRFVMSGTTTIAGAGGAAGLLRNVDGAVDRLEGLPMQVADSDTFPLGTPNKNITSGCDYNALRSPALVQQLQGYIPHISEGIDAEANNEFKCLSAQNDVVLPQTSIIHAVALSAADAAKVHEKRAKIVWSPRSNVDLYGETAKVVMLDMAGVSLSLGTDWMPSGSMNMLRELRCADELNTRHFDKHFTDADLWRMATANGALAVGAWHAIGSIRRGYLADLVVYDGKGRGESDHRAVLDAGVEDVALVLRGGKVLYGDTALVTSAPFLNGTACAPYAGDVCGRAKTACVDARVSGDLVDLATLRTTGEAFYPLFFCKDKVPDLEPTCVPFRDESVKGSSLYTGQITDADKDGDGIPNEQDDCPTIFNAVRPMDGGRQADADNDGIGDACDPCPFTPGAECSGTSVADRDQDGVPDPIDNCPDVPNPDQADADTDGRGDACDVCPAVNPGAVGCPLPIASVRDPSQGDHPRAGDVVRVSGYVSALKTSDFLFLQQETQAAPWQGIEVLTGAQTGTAATGLRVGDRITVHGVYHENFQTSRITGARVVVDSGRPNPVATIEPLTVTTSQINNAAGMAAEPYEGVLLRVDGPLRITNDNPDSGPFYEFVVTGNLRVDDYINTRHGTPATCSGQPCPYPPATLVNGTTFTSLTGIGGFSFGNRKLYPRSTTASLNDMPR